MVTTVDLPRVYRGDGPRSRPAEKPMQNARKSADFKVLQGKSVKPEPILNKTNEK
jgi:hypothetical protein